MNTPLDRLHIDIKSAGPHAVIATAMCDEGTASFYIVQNGCRIHVSCTRADTSFEVQLRQYGSKMAYLLAQGLCRPFPPHFAEPILRGLYDIFGRYTTVPKYPIDYSV